MHNSCIISLVELTFIKDVDLVGFLEIIHDIASTTFTVMEAYGGEHLFNIIVYQIEHITSKGGMSVIIIWFSQPGWLHRSKI